MTTTTTVRNHFDALMALYRATDDPDLAADIFAELADLDREAMTDPGLFEDLYGDPDDL